VIGLFLLFVLARGPAAPAELVVSTPRGETRMPILRDAAGLPLLPAAPLVAALNGTSRRVDAWAEVVIARQTFEFLLDAALVRFNGRLEPLAGPATVRRDTLFVPYQFVAEMLPRFFGERYHFDAASGHLVEVAPPAPAAPKRLPNGLLPGHIVTVDAGHGGDDPGNPGRFFPAGVREKHVTLQVALLLRAELERQGVKVRMTRTTDVRPNLLQRAPTCDATCDLFVSLHVDALDPRRRPDYRSFAGFSTLIIGEENSADADRVAETENEALRFESPEDQQLASGPLAFIIRDLQMNEYLRESARAAALVQQHLDRVHPGPDRSVKQRNDLAVLNTGRRPGVLVEMGYSSNQSDAGFMSSKTGQQKIARVLADAIVAYLMEFERKTGRGADSARPMR
jgi:N-acetylmuramoyl-L-alanine amidase